MLNNTLKYYESNYFTLLNRYESADVSEVQKLLLQTFHKNATLLEIGCGSGRDASFMLEQEYNVIAIDGSANMIEEAKKIHPKLSKKLFHKILPNDLEFDIAFDGVYSIATLMHLSKEDVSKTILQIYTLLKENGKFLISVSLFRDDVNVDAYDKKGRFFLLLSMDEWIDLFQDIGFKVLYTTRNKDGLHRSGIEWLTLVSQK